MSLDSQPSYRIGMYNDIHLYGEVPVAARWRNGARGTYVVLSLGEEPGTRIDLYMPPSTAHQLVTQLGLEVSRVVSEIDDAARPHPELGDPQGEETDRD